MERKYFSHTPPHGALQGSTFDMNALQAISKGKGGEGELAEVLHDALLEGNEYDRKIAEGASVMLRRRTKPSDIAQAIIDGKVKSPRLYDRKLSSIANVWSGDPKATGEKLPDWIQPGDILIGRIGGNVRKYEPGMQLQRNEIAIGIKPEYRQYADIDALRYFIESKINEPDLRLRGSVQQSLRVKDVKNLEVKPKEGFENVEEQAKFAERIGTIDELIKNLDLEREKAIMLRKGVIKQRRPFNKVLPNFEYDIDDDQYEQEAEEWTEAFLDNISDEGYERYEFFAPGTTSEAISVIGDYSIWKLLQAGLLKQSTGWRDTTDQDRMRYVQNWAEENRKMLREIDGEGWEYDDDTATITLYPSNRQDYPFNELSAEAKDRAIEEYIEGYADGTGYEGDELPTKNEVYEILEKDLTDYRYNDYGTLTVVEGENVIEYPTLGFEELFKDRQALLAWELQSLYGFKPGSIPTEIINTDNNRPYILTDWKPIPFEEPESTVSDFDWREEDDVDYQLADDAELRYQIADVKNLDDLRSEPDTEIELSTNFRTLEVGKNPYVDGYSLALFDPLEAKKYQRRISDGVWSQRSRDADTMNLPPLLTRRINGRQFVNFGTGYTSKNEASRSARRLRSKIDRMTGKQMVNVRTIKGSINGRTVWRNYVSWREY